MPTRCNRGFYWRSYCLLNMFRASLCPSSGAQEYYTVVAVCCILCCGFQVAGLVWSWGLCVRFAGCCSILQTGHITRWPKHVEQAIRSAIKNSVASSWHFISTYQMRVLISCTTFVWKIFCLRKIQWNAIIYIRGPSRKVPVIFVRFKWNLNFLERVSKNTACLLAQHVSGTGLCVRFAGCCSILQTGHINFSSTPAQQLENHSTKYHRQQPLYNTPELLMMGIVMPETCWASNKICNKNLCCI